MTKARRDAHSYSAAGLLETFRGEARKPLGYHADTHARAADAPLAKLIPAAPTVPRLPSPEVRLSQG